MKTNLNIKKMMLVAAVILAVACGLWLEADKQKVENVSIFKTAAADTPEVGVTNVNKYIRKSLRTVFFSMMVEDGVLAEEIRFNAPNQLNMLDNPARGIFHPKGGGAKYEFFNKNFLDEGYDGKWVFNAELAVEMLGEEQNTVDGRDIKSEIIAFMPGIKKKECANINQRLGIDGIPQLTSDLSPFYLKEMIYDGVKDYEFPKENVVLIRHELLRGQIEGCFESYLGNRFVYYYVIYAR